MKNDNNLIDDCLNIAGAAIKAGINAGIKEGVKIGLNKFRKESICWSMCSSAQKFPGKCLFRRNIPQMC